MSLFATNDLTIVKNHGLPNERRSTVRGRVDGNRAFFPLTTKVEVGDLIERPAPVGSEVLFQTVKSVLIFDQGSAATNHVEARLSGAQIAGQA